MIEIVAAHVALVCLGLAVWLFKKTIDRQNETFDLLDQVKDHAQKMREACVLIQYGAVDDAYELLSEIADDT